jgi:hypothetical protein
MSIVGSAIAIFCLAIAGCYVAHFVLIDEPIVFALLVVATYLWFNFGRSDDDKQADFVRHIYEGDHARGKDGRRWKLVKDGDGYVIQAGIGASALQCFRPEQGKIWTRGEAADRAVNLAWKS